MSSQESDAERTPASSRGDPPAFAIPVEEYRQFVESRVASQMLGKAARWFGILGVGGVLAAFTYLRVDQWVVHLVQEEVKAAVTRTVGAQVEQEVPRVLGEKLIEAAGLRNELALKAREIADQQIQEFADRIIADNEQMNRIVDAVAEDISDEGQVAKIFFDRMTAIAENGSLTGLQRSNALSQMLAFARSDEELRARYLAVLRKERNSTPPPEIIRAILVNWPAPAAAAAVDADSAEALEIVLGWLSEASWQPGDNRVYLDFLRSMAAADPSALTNWLGANATHPAVDLVLWALIDIDGPRPLQFLRGLTSLEQPEERRRLGWRGLAAVELDRPVPTEVRRAVWRELWTDAGHRVANHQALAGDSQLLQAWQLAERLRHSLLHGRAAAAESLVIQAPVLDEKKEVETELLRDIKVYPEAILSRGAEGLLERILGRSYLEERAIDIDRLQITRALVNLLRTDAAAADWRELILPELERAAGDPGSQLRLAGLWLGRLTVEHTHVRPEGSATAGSDLVTWLLSRGQGAGGEAGALLVAALPLSDLGAAQQVLDHVDPGASPTATIGAAALAAAMRSEGAQDPSRPSSLRLLGRAIATSVGQGAELSDSQIQQIKLAVQSATLDSPAEKLDLTAILRNLAQLVQSGAAADLAWADTVCAFLERTSQHRPEDAEFRRAILSARMVQSLRQRAAPAERPSACLSRLQERFPYIGVPEWVDGRARIVRADEAWPREVRFETNAGEAWWRIERAGTWNVELRDDDVELTVWDARLDRAIHYPAGSRGHIAACPCYVEFLRREAAGDSRSTSIELTPGDSTLEPAREGRPPAPLPQGASWLAATAAGNASYELGVEAQPGDALRVETRGLTGSVDTVVTIRDADSREVLAEDDDSGAERLASRLSYAVDRVRSLVIEISDIESDASPTDRFEVRLVHAVPDAHLEAAGSRGAATPLLEGTLVRVHVAEEEGWLLVRAKAGDLLRIETTAAVVKAFSEANDEAVQLLSIPSDDYLGNTLDVVQRDDQGLYVRVEPGSDQRDHLIRFSVLGNGAAPVHLGRPAAELAGAQEVASSGTVPKGFLVALGPADGYLRLASSGDPWESVRIQATVPLSLNEVRILRLEPSGAVPVQADTQRVRPSELQLRYGATEGATYVLALRDAAAAGAIALINSPYLLRPRDQTWGYRSGDRVVLGEHEVLSAGRNWATEMAAYVGCAARITEILDGRDNSGEGLVRVDLDGGEYVWRARNLTLAASDRAEPTRCDALRRP